MQNENEFSSKDLYLSAALLAAGHKVYKLEPLSPKTFLFVFNIPKTVAADLEGLFWERKLMVSARDYADALNELKTRIYQS